MTWENKAQMLLSSPWGNAYPSPWDHLQVYQVVAVSGRSQHGNSYNRLIGTIASVSPGDSGHILKIWPEIPNLESGKVTFLEEDIDLLLATDGLEIRTICRKLP